MNKKVIYSAVVGSYDNILQPVVVNPDFDYLLFSNDITEKSIGVWQIKKISYHNDDRTKIARWVKTHPEILLPDYEISVWMDANVQITGSYFYDRVLDLYDKGILVSSMWHSERDCIYEEAAVVSYNGFDHEKTIVSWIKILMQEGYPLHNGLIETNVVFRQHHHPIITELDSLWWWCINNYSRRDQLSFNYLLWRQKIDCPFFLTDNQNTRNSDCLQWKKHHNSKNRQVNKSSWSDLFIPYFRKYHSVQQIETVKNIYIKVSKLHCTYTVLFCIGQYYRMTNTLRTIKRKLFH